MDNKYENKVKESVRIDPSHIIQTGMAFWSSKVLLTAVKLDLFTLLAFRPLTSSEIKQKLCLHGRGLLDFLDALVALGFLQKNGKSETASYSNSADTDLFLDKNKLSYMGGFLEMANNRLYPYWNFLEETLKKGTPQNEIKTGKASLSEKIYAESDKSREFLNAMNGTQMGGSMPFASKFDFSAYKTLCDIGRSGVQSSA